METKQTPSQISDYAAETIHHKVRQLVGKVGFTNDDVEDLEQEMRADLLARLPKFNPEKAAHNTFVARLIDRKISTLIRYRTQEARDYRREACSLNDLLEDDEGNTIQRAYTVDKDAAEIRLFRRDRTREDEAQLRLDVSMVISGLPEDLQKVAERLMTETFTEAAKSLGMPRTTLYDARNRLRTIFQDAGLQDYL